jgi:hypothetical protein
MPTKIKVATPRTALTRVLMALERELIEATDEEVVGAAKDLGMDLQMQGSAAFMGLRYPAVAKLSDWFDGFPDTEKIGDDT